MHRTPFSRRVLSALALLAAVPAALGAFGESKATLRLLADRTAYEPGATARLAAEVVIDRGWHVNSNKPNDEFLIPTVLTLSGPKGAAKAKVRYPAHRLVEFPYTDGPIPVYDGKIHIIAELPLPASAAGAVEVAAKLRYQACDDKQCLPPTDATASVSLRLGGGGEPANPEVFEGGAPPGPAAPPPAGSGLLAVLLLGLVGGLILNAMPCVLPVLSLKIFGLMESAGKGRGHLVVGCLATTGGILLSFWALAGAAVLLRAAGGAVGWGIQFQQPAFVAFLAVVVVLFSLNMWGLFEIPLPAALARLGGGGPRQGLAGHFVTGLFATLMATPCSAPFLGTAVGFALVQPSLTIFAVFSAIGVGLALPYLLLAAVPAAVRWIPRPGAWMESFKGVMGFLLAGAAVWLFFVLSAQISALGVALVQGTLLVLALCVWLAGRTDGRVGQRLAQIGVAAAGAGGIWLAATSPAPAASGGGPEVSRFHQWIAFDEHEAERLASQEGKLVFVDVTADWCLTCKWNERTVLETQEVDELFNRHEIVTMKADWTNRNDRIARYLGQYGRSSIPFYALYRPGREPLVFNELLSKGRIRTAVRESVADLGPAG